MSNLINHAKRELDIMGMGEDSGEMNVEMRNDILALIELFASQGHSGFSAGYCADLTSKLMRFENLAPLQGTDDEWVEVGPNVYQNSRASNVFKDGKDAQAYQSDYRIFRDPDGYCVTNLQSREFITFPYIPTHIYIDRDADGGWE